MKANFLELLARHDVVAPATVGDLMKKADGVSSELVSLLAPLDARVRIAALDLILQEVASRMAIPSAANGKPSAELIQWARQTFNEEEFMVGLREIRETGGREFESFVEDLERAAGKHE